MITPCWLWSFHSSLQFWDNISCLTMSKKPIPPLSPSVSTLGNIELLWLILVGKQMDLFPTILLMERVQRLGIYYRSPTRNDHNSRMAEYSINVNFLHKQNKMYINVFEYIMQSFFFLCIKCTMLQVRQKILQFRIR